MTSEEALDNIKNWVEYLTRLDYVEPIVRGEVKELLYNAYHKTTPEFERLEKDLKILNILYRYTKINSTYSEQKSGATEAIEIIIPNCISIEEDDEYTDDCYPNDDFEIVKEWLNEDSQKDK